MNSHQIIITDNAIKHITNILNNEPDGTKFRISVESGGCTGLQYKFELDDKINNDDLIIQRLQTTILIDQMSQEFIKNCTIDYVETLSSAEFIVSNPNATAKCGCGNSFTI